MQRKERNDAAAEAEAAPEALAMPDWFYTQNGIAEVEEPRPVAFNPGEVAAILDFEKPPLCSHVFLKGGNYFVLARPEVDRLRQIIGMKPRD